MPKLAIPEAKFNLIIDGISEGFTLADMLEKVNCHRADFYKDLSDSTRNDSYAKAKQLQAETWTDRLLAAASKARIGEKRKVLADGSEEVTTSDCVDRSRLEVETLKWLMSKNHVKAYGDKVQNEITGANGGALVIRWDDNASTESGK